jgi:hypothetical protein
LVGKNDDALMCVSLQTGKSVSSTAAIVGCVLRLIARLSSGTIRMLVGAASAGMNKKLSLQTPQEQFQKISQMVPTDPG